MKTTKSKQNYYVGIDISKLTFDVTVINDDGFQLYERFSNDKQGFKEFNCWLKKCKGLSFFSAIICMEHTGIYTRQLVEFLLVKNAIVWMESPLQIKRSSGMVRGKSDKVDSQRIARYAMIHKDRLKPVTLRNKSLQLLKDLLNSRNRIIKAYNGLKKEIKEMKKIDPQASRELMLLQKPALTGLKKSQKQVELKMMDIINQDEELKNLFDLVTSVKGVGKVLATQLMIYTQLFTKFETAKQLSCYCGTAPFSHTSGTSIHGRIGTSNFANMDLKKTLHLVSMSSCKHVPEMKLYYERKLAQGKSKMSVLNAIRNKILHRIVAVVKRGTPYVEDFRKPELPTTLVV
jgi:transposase